MASYVGIPVNELRSVSPDVPFDVVSSSESLGPTKSAMFPVLKMTPFSIPMPFSCPLPKLPAATLGPVYVTLLMLLIPIPPSNDWAISLAVSVFKSAVTVVENEFSLPYDVPALFSAAIR